MLEYKSFPFEAKADSDKRIIKGYASVYNVVDEHGDLIMPGMFLDSIAEKFSPPKSRIKMLWLHGAPLGIPEIIREDSNGLYVEGRVSKTQLGDEALVLVDDGVVDEMSIGFRTQTQTMVTEESEERESNPRLRRILQKGELFEFSPVIWGANSHTYAEVEKALRFTEELKAGRVLSKSNYMRLKDAAEAILDVLARAEADDSPKDKKAEEIDDDVMNRYMQESLTNLRALVAEFQ